MQKFVAKGDLLYQADGYQIYDTDHPDYTIMDWENESACNLAYQLHTILRSHALSTSCVDRRGQHSLVVRRLRMLPLTVVANLTEHDTQVSFVNQTGQAIPLDDVKVMPGVQPNRLDCMLDSSTHAARTIRAHVNPLGLNDIELRLHYGIATVGDCCLQVINPLECQLGRTDYDALYTDLGGDFA